jgi:hypothetical protein
MNLHVDLHPHHRYVAACDHCDLVRSTRQQRINEQEWAANLREYTEDQARCARLQHKASPICSPPARGGTSQRSNIHAVRYRLRFVAHFSA